MTTNASSPDAKWLAAITAAVQAYLQDERQIDGQTARGITAWRQQMTNFGGTSTARTRSWTGRD